MRTLPADQRVTGMSSITLRSLVLPVFVRDSYLLVIITIADSLDLCRSQLLLSLPGSMTLLVFRIIRDSENKQNVLHSKRGIETG